jgi:hypothetical protein
MAGGGGAEAPLRADVDFVAKMEAAARRLDRGALAALLSEALECRKDRARAIVVDHLGEAFALALNAIGVPLEAATRILFSASPSSGQNADVVRALIGLIRSTPQRAASRIVGAVTGAARSECESSRRPTRDDSGVATRRRSASQASQRPSRKLDQSA